MIFGMIFGTNFIEIKKGIGSNFQNLLVNTIEKDPETYRNIVQAEILVPQRAIFQIIRDFLRFFMIFSNNLKNRLLFPLILCFPNFQDPFLWY